MAAYQGEDNILDITIVKGSAYTFTPPKGFNGEKYDLYLDFQKNIGYIESTARLFQGETYTDLSAVEALTYGYGYAKLWGEVYTDLSDPIENPNYGSNYIEYKVTKYLGMFSEIATYFETSEYQDRMPLEHHGLKYTGQIYPYKTGRTRYDGI